MRPREDQVELCSGRVSLRVRLAGAGSATTRHVSSCRPTKTMPTTVGNQAKPRRPFHSAHSSPPLTMRWRPSRDHSTSLLRLVKLPCQYARLAGRRSRWSTAAVASSVICSCVPCSRGAH